MSPLQIPDYRIEVGLLLLWKYIFLEHSQQAIVLNSSYSIPG